VHGALGEQRQDRRADIATTHARTRSLLELVTEGALEALPELAEGVDDVVQARTAEAALAVPAAEAESGPAEPGETIAE
jgi:hypothetical protein